MKFRNCLFFVIAILLIQKPDLYPDERNLRPVQLKFFINSHLNITTAIEYNEYGNVIKISSYEEGKITDYAKYRYDSERKVSHEISYNAAGMLLKTRVYLYDKSGRINTEKVYSPEGKLIEYLNIGYSGGNISKIDYFRTDNILFQTIDFRYSGEKLESMLLNKIGKHIMIIKPLYDKNRILTGHSIKHSCADVKIETRYEYEEGFATEESLQLIFR